MTFANGHKLPLDGWVLVVKTDLQEVTITPTSADSEDFKQKKMEWAKDLGKFHGFVPGDYRAQRVLAALASRSLIITLDPRLS